MEEILFLRHGLAYDRDLWVPEDGNTDDERRPLTEAGISGLTQSAAQMQALALGCEAIITSPLVRARQTAQIMHATFAAGMSAGMSAGPLIEDETLKPGFDFGLLKKLVKRYDRYACVMLVGHEPDFSDTIGDLIGGGHVIMKKGGLARVALRHKAKDLRGDLLWLVTPELLQVMSPLHSNL